MQINNKGFTLIEVLVVIVIVGFMSGIVISNVMSSVNVSKEKTFGLLKSNIVIGAKNIIEEICNGETIYKYDLNGNKSSDIVLIQESDEGKYIIINLQTLVSNGFLSVSSNDGKKVILEPINNKNIGECQIKITRSKNDKGKILYNVQNISTDNSDCPEY